VLLDVVMPVMDGYEVLAVMNNKRWIDDIPVIMISAENSKTHIERAYELGVTDFISHPFDAHVVRRRVVNTLMLYAKQKKLIGMVADQIYQKERNSGMMINILSHIVEFRNGESGLHILHVQAITEILLKRLVEITDRYKLSSADITLISTASALHDIGKISIPDEILNKPGKLTKEEFEIMKTHSMAGAQVLADISFYKDEQLVKYAYDICRWHHERYDGRGYPDGLHGDEIPISAQIVAIADVYDALTSDRVYKKAFSHEVAMEMILNGECGTFNPLVLDCLRYSEETIKTELATNSLIHHNEEKEMKSIAEQMLGYEELSSTERTIKQLEYERMKNNFYISISQTIVFEYTADPPMTTLSPYGADKLGIDEVTVNPLSNDKTCASIHPDDLLGLKKAVYASSAEKPLIEYECKIKSRGVWRDMKIICRTVWTEDAEPKLMAVIGKMAFIGD
jgi:putative two-component system response regulator